MNLPKILCLAFLAIVMMLPSLASAQRNARQAEREISRLLDDARTAYDNLELEESDSSLSRAVRLGEKFGVDSPAMAEVYLQRGVLTFVKDKNEGAASRDFKRALEIDPRIRLDPLISTPSLERLFEKAKRGGGGRGRRDDRGGRNSDDDRGGDRYDRGGDRGRDGDRGSERDRDGGRDRGGRGRDDDRGSDRGRDRGGRGRDDDRTESRRDPDRYGDDRGRGRSRSSADHRPPRSASGGEALKLSVTLSSDVDRDVYRGFAYVRTARSSSPKQLEMRPDGASTFMVRVPRTMMVGNEISYYFQFEDRSGEIIATSASARTPHRIPIRGDALGASEIASGSRLDGSGGDERRFESRRGRDRADNRDGGRSRRDRDYEDRDDFEDDDYGDDDSSDKKKSFAFGLSVGTGAGWVTEFATPVERGIFDARVDEPGVSATPFHSLVEADFWLSDKVALSAFARIQIIEFADLYGARLKYIVSKSRSSEFRLRLGGGYGWIRHLIQLGEVFDTTLEGPGMITVGFSWVKKINSTTNFIFSPDYLQLFGPTTPEEPYGPSYHLDLNLGVEFLL